MSDKKHQAYSSEFKESSVKLAIESKQPISQTAKDLGIKANTLYTWVDKYSKPKEASVRTDDHIYDENKNLIGIAKLSKPVKKTEGRDLTFKIKLDL